MAHRQAVTSFKASDVPSGELGPILGDYLALERLKIFRRLLLTRIGALAACAGLAAHLSGMISPPAVLALVAALMAIPAMAWLSELRAEARLVRRLSAVPHEKVIKSS